MTSTTTLKLPEPLKARIAPLAEAAGKTPHAWMIDALEAQAALAEMREAFIAEAEASAADVDAGGPGLRFDARAAPPPGWPAGR